MVSVIEGASSVFDTLTESLQVTRAKVDCSVIKLGELSHDVTLVLTAWIMAYCLLHFPRLAVLSNCTIALFWGTNFDLVFRAAS